MLKNKKKSILPLPPASLRYRVHGSKDVDSFLRTGRKCAEDVESALKRIGRQLDSFQKILDFGCGCGRTLRWFADYFQQCDFYGADFDKEAISWCRKNIHFAKFAVNKPLPPLKYPSGMFDLIYALSVFTHLDEDYQFNWLSEVKRITKPKGILLITFQGEYCWKNLYKEDIGRVKKRGFIFIPAPQWAGLFPSWYQAAYHTKRYVLDNYSKYFRVLDYIPKGLNNHQDVVILENRRE